MIRPLLASIALILLTVAQVGLSFYLPWEPFWAYLGAVTGSFVVYALVMRRVVRWAGIS